MNTYFTEHLAGKHYRESKSGEEYHHPRSLTACVIYYFQYSINFLSCVYALPFQNTIVNKKSFI